MSEKNRKVSIEIDIKNLSFPIGIRDDIDVVALVESGIVEKLEFID
jgi:hypothetical protein